MVNTYNQAVRIQTSRVKAGKRGYAKAVRRFMVARYDKPARSNPDLPVKW